MSRRDDQRLVDILAAAIADHLSRGGLDDRLVFDAVRVRLIEIGEAARAIDPHLLAREPAIPWIDVAGMRNHLAHRYFDTAHAIAAKRLLDHLAVDPRRDRWYIRVSTAAPLADHEHP